MEDRDAALRLVDGPAAAPPVPSRQRKIARLGEEIPALTASIALHDERIGAAERACAQHSRPLNDAVINLTLDMQGPAVAEVREALLALRQPFVRLMATEVIRQRMLGDTFTVPAGREPPLSASTAIRKFLNNLPRRFAMPELGSEALDKAARNHAALVINAISKDVDQ